MGGGHKYNSLVYFGFGTPDIPSPLVPINEISRIRHKAGIRSSVHANIKLLPGLNLKTNFSFLSLNRNHKLFKTSQAESDGNPAPVIPFAKYSTSRIRNWFSATTLHYKNGFSGKQSIDLLAGFTAQENYSLSGYFNATNFPVDEVRTLNAGQVTSGLTTAGVWSLLSYYVRLNYTLDDKYLLTISARRDGSSRFGSGNKWGFFPSLAVAWRIAQERFMKDIPYLSQLKLRVGYGVTGNNLIPEYGSFSLLDINGYVFGSGSGNVVNGIIPKRIANSKLGWEKSRELNIGLDVGFFKQRLQFSANWYISKSHDLLLNVGIPAIMGFTHELKNIGKLRNKGWGISVNTVNVNHKFRWTTGFNISSNNNEVLALGPNNQPIFAGPHDGYVTKVGYPIGSMYGYVFVGIYNTPQQINSRSHLPNDTPGDPIIKDINRDGKISAADRTIIGNSVPNITYGLTNIFSYRNLSLRVLIQGIQGSQVMARDFSWLFDTEGKMNVSTVLLNRWHSPSNPGNGKIPEANARLTGVQRLPSTMWLIPNSYLRIRNITLGYKLPQKLFGDNNMSLKVFFSVQNAVTFTKYIGYNPEVSSKSNNPLTPGIQVGVYPLARKFIFGVNLSL